MAQHFHICLELNLCLFYMHDTDLKSFRSDNKSFKEGMQFKSQGNEACVTACQI